MELLIFGIVLGIAIAVAGFVVWNLNSPKGVDKAEESIREHTESWDKAKQAAKDKVAEYRKQDD